MIGQCDGNLRELQQLQVHTATRLTRYLSHSPTVCLSLLYSVFIILTHSLSVSLFVSVRSLFVFLSLTFLHSLSLSCLWIGHSPSFFFTSLLSIYSLVFSVSLPLFLSPSLALLVHLSPSLNSVQSTLLAWFTYNIAKAPILIFFFFLILYWLIFVIIYIFYSLIIVFSSLSHTVFHVIYYPLFSWIFQQHDTMASSDKLLPNISIQLFITSTLT